MPLLIISLIILPFFSAAQINRSATELAKERISEYITTKIFRGHAYEPGSYGVLKPLTQSRTQFNWLLSHQFQIVDTQLVEDKKAVVKTPYIFSFYLDKKLNVVSADGYHLE